MRKLCETIFAFVLAVTMLAVMVWATWDVCGGAQMFGRPAIGLLHAFVLCAPSTAMALLANKMAGKS